MGRPSNTRLVIALAIAAAIAMMAHGRCGGSGNPRRPTTTSSRARIRLGELRHQPPGSIAGSVSAAKAPVAGATVCVRPTKELEHSLRCTTTDERGGYAIDDLAPGAYVVWASAPKLAGDRWRGPAPAFDDSLWIEAGKRRTGIDLVLLAGAVDVHGAVADVRGKPIPGAVIHAAGDPRAPPSFTTRTAPDGTFVVWVLPGNVYVEASADGYVDGEAHATAPTAKLEIVLTPESVLAGIVVEAGSHRPIEDAMVTVYSNSTRTDADGRFRLTKLGPGRYKPIAMSIGGYGETAESVLLGLGRTVDGLVIEVHPVAVVVGRVIIDEGGTTRPCPPDQGSVSLNRYGSSAYYRARTATDGDILLEGVVPGTYQVTASCEHFLPQIPYPDLTVGNSDVEDLTWKVLPGARVTGHVLTRAGAPIADASINIVSGNGVTFANATSDAEGAFVADGLAPGKTEVVAHASGFAGNSTPGSIMAAIGNVARIDLILDTGGTITGDVVDDTGKPVVVVVEARGPDTESDWTDEHGHFTISALAAGSYEVTARTQWGDPPARADHDGPRPVETIVAADKVSHVRLIAESTPGEITGVVVDATETPITDAYVVAAREDESATDEPSYRSRGAWRSKPVLTALDGSFRITELPEGRFAIRAYREGGADAVVEHVAIGERTRLTIRPIGVLAGVIVASDGAPVDDVTLSAVNKPREVSRDERLYHTGGRFVLRDLPAGTYRLTVDGDVRSQIVVTLAEGETQKDLHLVAQPRFTIRGRLVSARGAPLAGWKVEAPRLENIESTNGRTVVVSTSEIAITDPTGHFLIHDMISGPTTLSAGDVSHDPEGTLAVIREIDLQGTTDVDLGDVAVAGAR